MKINKNITKTVYCFSLLVVPVMLLCLSGCVTSYNIQVFSDDVKALPYTTIDSGFTNQDGSPVYKTAVEGIFEARDYETAMRNAQKAGFTKVLSVEYGTRHVLWSFFFSWVTVRCEREGAAVEPAKQVISPKEPARQTVKPAETVKQASSQDGDSGISDEI